MSHLYLQQPSRVFRVCKLAGVADIVSRAFERVYKPSNSLLVSVDTNQVQPTVLRPNIFCTIIITTHQKMAGHVSVFVT